MIVKNDAVLEVKVNNRVVKTIKKNHIQPSEMIALELGAQGPGVGAWRRLSRSSSCRSPERIRGDFHERRTDLHHLPDGLPPVGRYGTTTAPWRSAATAARAASSTPTRNCSRPSASSARRPRLGAARAEAQRLGAVARLPVRTSAAYPKQDVPELLAAIYALRVAMPVHRGDVLIKDFKGSGVDVIATRTLLNAT